MEYPESSKPQHNKKQNKSLIVKMKFVTKGVPIVEFIGFNSKMYSFVKEDDEGQLKTKG